ncbi:cytochrome C biogenesis protein [Pseudothauera nasutitermitis]|uniref:Cytochrome C biogenesis protein n=1 Tax=Pseudothauera nasutitermitis TaxID=2565930 RepID=A0A4S4AUP7_9RHOO|nr:cytochrome c biogenesis protein CcsA [Pseudothauera nasutitermitis]THF63618.1 cytochrome C biogenesis protein [Pseudothauera nasutitermitis]
MASILLHLVPASLYGALGLYFWRTSWLNNSAAPRQSMTRRERLLLLAALLVHGAALHTALFSDGQMHFGFGVAVSLMIWLAICFYWVETLYARLDGLHALAMPAGVIGALLPILFPGEHVLTNAGSPAFRAHFIIAMLAYSLFTLAALHAMLMAVAERQLHHARFTRALSNLPPLLTMEALLFRLIGIAFVLLTLTLVSGVAFSESLFGQAFRIDHKTVFAFVSWLLFGILLAGRHLWGWRGRMALRWTLAGFVALLLAYVGSRFVIEVLLARAG